MTEPATPVYDAAMPNRPDPRRLRSPVRPGLPAAVALALVLAAATAAACRHAPGPPAPNLEQPLAL
ncbi:MAG: hypothetical protein H6P95_123, partial [Candidatus Aminicenantes bacterium]|nr:hypothetical protein [Candidatus Aminicenantes bacterium]